MISTKYWTIFRPVVAIAVLALAMALLGLHFSPVVAQGTDGICDRTQRVKDRILVQLRSDDCSAVTDADLASVKSLGLRRNPSTESEFTLSLQSGDFDGLVSLTELDLADTGLRSLPPGVFAGLTNLVTLNLQKNSSLRTLPYDEFEDLESLTDLRVDRQGRRKLQVAGGEVDATLEVAQRGTKAYEVRLMAAPDSRVDDSNPVRITVTVDAAGGVTATPEMLDFTEENWFRSQIVTVRAGSSASGTVEIAHEATGTTQDSAGQAQSNYDFEEYPLPTVTVQVSVGGLQKASGGSD